MNLNAFHQDVYVERLDNGLEVILCNDKSSPVAAIQLSHKTFEGYLLRQGGTFLGSTNKGNPFKFPTEEGKYIDRSKEIRNERAKKDD